VQTKEWYDFNGAGWKRVSTAPFFFGLPSTVSHSTVEKDEFRWDWTFGTFAVSEITDSKERVLGFSLKAVCAWESGATPESMQEDSHG
jgi:hypothetical protein